MRSHFRSHDKGGGHTIRSAIAENVTLHADFTDLCSVELASLLIVVLRCGNRDKTALFANNGPALLTSESCRQM